MIFFGKNECWYYFGNHTYFNGNIKLNFWKYWIFLGGFYEILCFILNHFYPLGHPHEGEITTSYEFKLLFSGILD